VLDLPAPIDEHADLAADVRTDLGQVTGELVGHHPIGGDPPVEETLELPHLAGLEALRIAVDLDEKVLPGTVARSRRMVRQAERALQRNRALPWGWRHRRRTLYDFSTWSFGEMEPGEWEIVAAEATAFPEAAAHTAHGFLDWYATRASASPIETRLSRPSPDRAVSRMRERG